SRARHAQVSRIDDDLVTIAEGTRIEFDGRTATITSALKRSASVPTARESRRCSKQAPVWPALRRDICGPTAKKLARSLAMACITASADASAAEASLMRVRRSPLTARSLPL